LARWRAAGRRTRSSLTSRWSLRSLHAHDDLAEGASLAHPRQRLGHFVEGERAVDVDAELTRYTETSDRFEMRRPFLDRQHAQPAAREPTGQRADRQHAQQRPDRPADA